jgi:pyrrolysine biosynthesis protein PylD
MTRLVKSDVEEIERDLCNYDAGLVQKTGLTLRQIAAKAANITEQELDAATASCLTAVVPITAGQGIIEYFAHSVRSILTHIGCRTFVTRENDVTGIAAGAAAGAGLLFMADDQRFIALNLHSGTAIDNGEATGRGYVAALDGVAGGLSGEAVLVLGAGPVGCGAITMLQEIGSRPAVYEIDAVRARLMADRPGVIIENDLRDALVRYRLIVDATPQPSFIDLEDLHPDALMAAPGIPLGLTAGAYAFAKDRVIWDPLQIGVATMLAMAISR